MKNDSPFTHRSVGETVRSIRLEMGMNQSQLAEAVGLSIDYIYKLESRQKWNPSIYTVFKLASTLEISFPEFVCQIGANM